MDFPLEQEKPGGTQEFLLKLRDSRLQDEALLKEFYQKVIDHYDYGENYYIILIHAAYDVPGKASDGSEMFDASDSVYEYVLCSICPVHLTKPGLCYNTSSNAIQNRIRDWLVEAPVKGFLFPVFNDRCTDIHSVLYYSKKPEDLQPDFIQQIFGCSLPMSAENQKETFNSIIADTLGDGCEYDVVKNIHNTLNEILEKSKDEPEPPALGKNSLKRVLEESGVPDEKLETFDSYYEEIGENTPLMVSNITNTRAFQIKTPDVVVKVNPECADLVETRMIDGRACLVIAINEQIEVNGVNVTATSSENSEQE